MQNLDFQKLDWDLILSHLASLCQTEEAKKKSLTLKPSLSRAEILAHWDYLSPLVDLMRKGSNILIGEITPIARILKAASVGEILDGPQLRDIFRLLDSVRSIISFSKEIVPFCGTLTQICAKLRPLPHLYTSIAKSISETGEIYDHASPLLMETRLKRVDLKKKIEVRISQFIRDPEVSAYIQDDFYTVRHERYVLPLKLDGRGRVAGSIVDTSSSGQTLFIEPAFLTPMNETLRDLDLSEKLEMIRILRSFTEKIAEEAQALSNNYDDIIELDFLSGQAQLAYKLGANAIRISEEPILDLRAAVHPLLLLSDKKKPISNDISISDQQKVLVLSGPNAGGKTLILKTTGLLHLMAACGLMIPAHPSSQIFLFSRIFVELGDMQSLSSHLSTFSGHIAGLKPILETASKNDLLLLDELCVGTEPETGVSLAQALLEEFAERGSFVLTTTHYDRLKTLAFHDPRFRNGSMGYSHDGYSPTYQLIFDSPGKSYGLEIAEKLGLKSRIIERARSLRGSAASTLEKTLSVLNEKIQVQDDQHKEWKEKTNQALSEKTRWEQEVQLLNEMRKKTASALAEQYEEVFGAIRKKFEDALAKFSSAAAKPEADSSEVAQEKRTLSDEIKTFKEELIKLKKQGHSEKAIGQLASFEKLSVGDRVYITSFQKEGRIVKKGKSAKEKFEVETGTMKVKVPLHSLRFLSHSSTPRMFTKPNKLAIPVNLSKKSNQQAEPEEKGKTKALIQTSTNTCDVRGLRADEALSKMWRFIDGAMLRGDLSVLIIHGHGTDTLKQSIRTALEKESPYEIQFEAGSLQDGGDGVTWVMF